jgi:hypothetical protein
MARGLVTPESSIGSRNRIGFKNFYGFNAYYTKQEKMGKPQ